MACRTEACRIEASRIEPLEGRRLLSVSACPEITATWNVDANTGSGPSEFGGRTFDAAEAPELLLDLGTGQVEVHSFSWGVTNSGSASSGSGTGAGVSHLADLHVSANLGDAAAGVFHAVTNGAHIPQVVLEGRDDQGGDLQFRYTLQDVIVSSYSTGGTAAGAGASLSDSLSFDYATVTFEQFDDDAQPSVTRTATWSAAHTGSGPSTFGGGSFPQGSEPPITLDLGSGTIEALSFSWGATQLGTVSTGGGGGAGKVQFSDLNLTTVLGDASAGLFYATASGRHLPTVVLESRDGDGDIALRYTLEDVIVTSYQVGGSAGSAGAVESVGLDFASIEVEQFEPKPGGGMQPLPTASWDVKTNSGSGPTTFGNQIFTPGGEPDLLLDLGTGMVELDSFSWGATNPSTIGSGSGGAGAGTVTFQDFHFAASPGLASPGLFYHVASGRHVPQAVLVVRNPSGDVDARYTLSDVIVSGYQTNGAAGDNLQQFSLDVGAVELEQTLYNTAGNPAGSRTASWSVVSNTGTGSAIFPTRNFPAGDGSDLVLKLGDWEMAADSFSWGVSNSAGSSTGGGTGAGKASVGSLHVSAELGEVTPTLLYAMASGSHLPQAVLQQRDDDGRVVFEYVLSTVVVSSYSTGGVPGGTMPDTFSLDFRAVELTHTDRKPDGSVEAERTVSWDSATNTGGGDIDFSGAALPAGAKPDQQLLVDGAAVEVLSFSWGATNSGASTGSGAGAGKVNFQDLSLSLDSGPASPSWVLAAANGQHLPDVVLESRNADGDVYLRYILTDVIVTSYQTGASSGGSGVDQVTLDFAGIELEQTQFNTDGSVKDTQTTSWNVQGNTGNGAADFGDNVFPDGDEPPLVLRISADELAPGAFNFGASNSGTIGGGGAGAGKANLSDLHLSGAAGTATAGLLYAVSSGVHVPGVVLEVRDADGNVVRTITLQDVIVSSHQVSGSGAGAGAESFSLNYGGIALTTHDCDAPAPLEVTITGPAVGSEGSALHLAGSADGGDDAGDIDFAWTVTRGGAAVASGTGDDIDFTPADDGTYLLTLNASAENGATGSATRSIVVSNVAPTLSLFGAATVNERTPYTIQFAATDPGADTITQWTVDWGDGTAVSLLPGTATSATHSYATGGRTYVITLSATDEDGSYAVTRSVSVRTPKQAVEAIAARVEALLAAGTLGGGNAGALQSKLSAAAKSLDAANRKAAAGQLGAFVNQSEALSGRKLPFAVAASLVDEAEAVLALLV